MFFDLGPVVELPSVPGPVVPGGPTVPATSSHPVVTVQPEVPIVPNVPAVVVNRSVEATGVPVASTSQLPGDGGPAVEIQDHSVTVGHGRNSAKKMSSGARSREPELDSEETPYVPETGTESEEEYDSQSGRRRKLKRRKRSTVAVRDKRVRTRLVSPSSSSAKKSGPEEACRSREYIPIFTTSEEEPSDTEPKKAVRTQKVGTVVEEVHGSSKESGSSKKGKCLKGNQSVSLSSSKSGRSDTGPLGVVPEPRSFPSMVPVLHRLDEKSISPAPESQSSVSTIIVGAGSVSDVAVESSPGSSISLSRKKLLKKVPGHRWVAKGVVPGIRVPFAPRSTASNGCGYHFFHHFF